GVDDIHLLGGSYAGMSSERMQALEHCPNLFQLLELVEDRGSGGSVEKIVISQESFGRLLNLLQPGSYTSISKINLKSLDKLSIKPTGIYGDPLEIIMFLQRVGIFHEKSALLMSRAIKSSGPNSLLGSGIYLALDPNHQARDSKPTYIIYWPEGTTWQTSVSASVRNNRIMFMRHLTKLTDQTIALVSPDQARGFDWDASPGQLHQNIESQDLGDRDTGEQGAGNDSSFHLHTQRETSDQLTLTTSPGCMIRVGPGYFLNGGPTEARLVPGEEKVGLLVVSRNFGERKFEETLSAAGLRRMIQSGDWVLGQVSGEDIETLAAHGLREKYSVAFETYDQRLQLLHSEREALEAVENRRIEQLLKKDKDAIIAEAHKIMETIDGRIYPSLGLSGAPSESGITAQMRQKYPLLDAWPGSIQKAYEPSMVKVKDEGFQTLKSGWSFVRTYFAHTPKLTATQRNGCIDYVFNRLLGTSQSRGVANPLSAHWIIGSDPFSSLVPNEKGQPLDDPGFVGSIPSLELAYPELSGVAQRIHFSLRHFLTILKEDIISDQVARVLSSEWECLAGEEHEEREHRLLAGQQQAFEALLQYLRKAMHADMSIPSGRQVNRVTELPGAPHSDEVAQFCCAGYLGSSTSARDHFSVYPLTLAQPGQNDWARLSGTRLGVETRRNFEFALLKGRAVDFIQLIRDKCLVVVSEKGQTRIYIEDNVNLEHAIHTTHGKVTLSHDSLGGSECKFALDQATRLLAIVHGQKDDLKLSIFIFDELFANLRSRGSPIPLKSWYNQPVDIAEICLVSGLEEVCLVEKSGRVRVFSLITQQFRNASLQIDQPITDAFSAPDGSCLLVAVAGGGGSSSQRLLAFHWASFGKNKKGIDAYGLPPCDGYRVVTRFEGRGRVHVISFNSASQAISSTVLQITQKATEFSFRSDREHARKTAAETINNSLIDCHLEVWTRFPVVSTVSCNTLVVVNRQPRQLVFSSPIVLPEVEEYFDRMISKFETTTRKPIGGSLTAIEVTSTNRIEQDFADKISEFRLGSFIVELLCLIPLHLAVTRENRFIPLKDGVWDLDYERSLLGADIPAIIDALSLGWYESLFQSYMATKVKFAIVSFYGAWTDIKANIKSVRVVSSMGEQSVGKSYCLNHFADTSFAGSAMRTMEGVWLSCTPTEKYLLVSLDFEGVHSIERSAQEDALLVLFNTAISNLVLFRNNFAMSRDIAGLFTSFQSSATVLDPNVNRGLFNSTLAIIIKDVTNADSRDIVKECVSNPADALNILTPAMLI
ncbi:hypothetical protein FRC11_005176, partial [Ceratobasidium sp. 423]